MSDSCYLSINVKNCDVKKFKQIFEPIQEYPADEENKCKRITIFIFYEANYGFYNELKSLAQSNIIFEGSHEAGGIYGSGEFACFGDGYYEIETGHEGGYVCDFDSKGNILSSSATIIKEFFAIQKQIYAYFDKSEENLYPTLAKEGDARRGDVES